MRPAEIVEAAETADQVEQLQQQIEATQAEVQAEVEQLAAQLAELEPVPEIARSHRSGESDAIVRLARLAEAMKGSTSTYAVTARTEVLGALVDLGVLTEAEAEADLAGEPIGEERA